MFSVLITRKLNQFLNLSIIYVDIQQMMYKYCKSDNFFSSQKVIHYCFCCEKQETFVGILLYYYAIKSLINVIC